MLALEIILKMYLEQNKMVYFHIGIQLTTGITCGTFKRQNVETYLEFCPSSHYGYIYIYRSALIFQ